MLGSAAAVACILAAISGLLPSNSRMLEMATTQPTELTPTASDSPLMVAVNNPVIEIPKTAVAPSEKPVNNLN
jgi:hypothetical protein